MIQSIQWLKGKKTYIVATLILFVNLAFLMKWIDEATRDLLVQLLGAGAVATVAAKVNRINKKVS